MQIDQVTILGYRRFLEASAYIGRKTVALVGPNEAGKTSFLSSLLLLNSSEAVPTKDFTRSLRGTGRGEDDDVVVVRFELTPQQRSIVSDLPLGTRPTHFRFHKKVNGEVKWSLFPRPTPADGLRRSAKEAWLAVRAHLPTKLDVDPDDPDDQDAIAANKALTAIDSYFQTGGAMPSAAAWNLALENARGLTLGTKLHAQRLATLNEFLTWWGPASSISSTVWKFLDSPTRPKFLLFREEDRALRASYFLSDPSTNNDVALANLLALADLDLDALSDPNHERPYRQTLVEDATAQLNRYFRSTWSQEKVTVGFHLEGDELAVDVRDLNEGSPGWLSITERSDGLRTFVALAAFLHANTADASSPILLIDEAEQHLHLNAQADLVRMLQNLDTVSQIIYSTHSPGCLPSDLGNGVRFVQPQAGSISIVRHDFWSLSDESHIGFNPLLFVMGAGAAAFSSLRRALVVEGPADMLLLPTLIKLATGQWELSYQVAPGVSSASKLEMLDFDYVASRVAYLVDGDLAGVEWAKQLRAAGVPPGRIRSLSFGLALEDLLDPEYYVGAIRWFGVGAAAEVASLSKPIKSSLSRALGRDGESMPGPVAVVEAMLGRHESGEHLIRLSTAGRRVLVALNSWIETALDSAELAEPRSDGTRSHELAAT